MTPFLSLPATRSNLNGLLAVLADEGGDLRVGLGLPAAAVKDAVMADIELQVVCLFCPRQIVAQPVRRDGLPDRADIVALAFDGHQRGALDCSRIDRIAAHAKAAMRQILP